MPAPPSPSVRLDLSDWYWAVAGSTTQVYSSKLGNYVPVSDSGYQAWLAKPGSLLSTTDTEDALGRTQARNSDIVGRPIPPGVLDGFQNELSDIAEEVFRVLLAPAKLNIENRIRACERALGISTAPDLTGPQLKQLLKSLA